MSLKSSLFFQYIRYTTTTSSVCESSVPQRTLNILDGASLDLSEAQSDSLKRSNKDFQYYLKNVTEKRF